MIDLMRRLTTLFLAVLLSVATFAIAWASATSMGTATPGAPTHSVHAESVAVPSGGGPAIALAVHHGHPDGVSTEDCAAMALGCAGLVAHSAPDAASAPASAKGLRARPRDVIGQGVPPARLDRPPRG